MPRIYYAHPMSWYDTREEQEDVLALTERGTVINPNSAMFRQSVEMAKLRGTPIMDIFADYIKNSVDVVCFRRFNDGYIGSGVAREILEATIWGKQLWEIDRGGKRGLPPCIRDDMIDYNVGLYHILTVEQTRARIIAKEL